MVISHDCTSPDHGLNYCRLCLIRPVFNHSAKRTKMTLPSCRSRSVDNGITTLRVCTSLEHTGLCQLIFNLYQRSHPNLLLLSLFWCCWRSIHNVNGTVKKRFQYSFKKYSTSNFKVSKVKSMWFNFLNIELPPLFSCIVTS